MPKTKGSGIYDRYSVPFLMIMFFLAYAYFVYVCATTFMNVE